MIDDPHNLYLEAWDGQMWRVGAHKRSYADCVAQSQLITDAIRDHQLPGMRRCLIQVSCNPSYGNIEYEGLLPGEVFPTGEDLADAVAAHLNYDPRQVCSGKALQGWYLLAHRFLCQVGTAREIPDGAYELVRMPRKEDLIRVVSDEEIGRMLNRG